jgi:hypothetical protein
MKSFRHHLSRWTAVVLGSLAVSVLGVRSGLVRHEHAGGDHTHVHLDAPHDHGSNHDHSLPARDRGGDRHAHRHDHGDHAHAAVVDHHPGDHHHHGPTTRIAVDDGTTAIGTAPATPHWHAHNPFQRGAASDPPRLTPRPWTAALAAATTVHPPEAIRLAPCARGPPLSHT